MGSRFPIGVSIRREYLKTTEDEYEDDDEDEQKRGKIVLVLALVLVLENRLAPGT